MEINPYQSPLTPGEEGPPRKSEGSDQSSIAAWERLRLLYNGILVGVVVLTTMLDPTKFLIPEFWIGGLFGGIGANVCYCVGAPLEYYLCRIGSDRQRARIFLFVLGTLFSVLVTFAQTLLAINDFQIHD